MKIDQCDRCLLYARNAYLVCTIHPEGVDTNKCPDFRLDPDAKEQDLWSPEGYCWYDGELIPNRPRRYTQEQQLAILDSHPFFTGVCRSCGYEFESTNSPRVHWDCPVCGRVDDSV